MNTINHLMRCIWMSFIFLLPVIDIMEQFDSSEDTNLPIKYQFNGYIKDLVTIGFADDSTTFDNLILNRLNFKWFMADNMTFFLDVRNRLFTGNTVKNVEGYDRFVDSNNDYFDFSAQGPQNESWLFQSMIDRAYLEWYKGDWELRAGRQRINWGVNLIWNPNDLFNVYSFFDFDYEERPGSDAIRIKRYMGFASCFVVACFFQVRQIICGDL